jgi:predicted RNase H-related nuclease YkuK (DUF458 family)
MKNRDFMVMGRQQTVDLIERIEAFKSSHPDMEVYIGCDSQNYRGHTVYVRAVVLRVPGAGAHVLFQREKIPPVKDLWSRLWREIEQSLEVASFVRENTGIEVKQVDLDLNENPEFPSNKVLKAARGYVAGMGFNPQAKPAMLPATWAANVLCH